jgi:hypothetical protein
VCSRRAVRFEEALSCFPVMAFESVVLSCAALFQTHRRLLVVKKNETGGDLARRETSELCSACFSKTKVLRVDDDGGKQSHVPHRFL